MITVRQLLERKGYDIWSIAPDASVYDTVRLMADKNVGALMVVEGPKLVGVVSERDVARKIVLQEQHSKHIPVEKIMTSNVLCIHPEQTIEECMALMTDKRIRHLPVIEEDEELIGVISIGDVVKADIADKEFIIEQLETFITGRQV
ncbi:MAG: Arabinose 5-phosphate isomerase KdsD [Anaerolineales bacterium]|nr:Arabinose 5-phosphate isomerase KdsD [Anaerolineales bacterium]